MYTFAPIPDVPVSHGGLFFMALACGVMFWYCAVEGGFKWACAVFVVGLMPVLGITYGISYHWTDQEPVVYKNEKVIGTFVKYESEGYRERSGKSYADRHYTYVVYNVEGGNVMLPAATGVAYPERAVLYKN